MCTEGTTKQRSRAGTKTRRAVVAIWTASLSVVLIGFAALALDLGYVMVVRVQLQNAADAAAMAGVSAFANPLVLDDSAYQEQLPYQATLRAMDYAAKNQADNESLQISWSDVSVGRISNPENLQEAIIVGAQPYNAVRVLVKKGSDSPNRPVQLLFARIWGYDTASVAVVSTAILDTRVSGYRPLENQNGPLMPIVVREQKWIDEVVNQGGNDNYGIDPDTGAITNGPDGIREISIYPEKKKEFDPEGDGAGNFGLININTDNNGAVTIADQIRNGLTQQDLAGEFGQSEIGFTNDDGSPKTLNVGGTPGLKTSLNDDFTSRVGDVIGFFLHGDVQLNGSNATYELNGMQFGRLVSVSLTGSPDSRVIVIQPTVYVGREIKTDSDAAPHTTSGRIRLVR